MKKNSRIFIAGNENIAGRGLIQYFKSQKFSHISSETVRGLDLMKQDSVRAFLKRELPEYVFLTNARCGGIAANMKYPAELIYENLQVQNNILHYSYKFGVKKLLFFGSSCMYSNDYSQPIKEEYLLAQKIEETSQAYAIAKIAGVEMIRAYRKQYGLNYFSLVPATIYGPGDNFDSESGHVIPSLIKRFDQAKSSNLREVVLWGTGSPRREFIYLDDLISVCVFLMKQYNTIGLINAGYGQDISIKELALLIKDIVGFKGKIVFDYSKPDGAQRKLLDSSKIRNLGWKPEVSLQEGISRTYNWYRKNLKQGGLN